MDTRGRQLLTIRDAGTARNAEKAVRMYMACTRNSQKENRRIYFSAEFQMQQRAHVLAAEGSPYRRRDERVRKNSAGVAIRSPVRFATACVKCLVVCVSNQSGLLAIAERRTGTSAACLIR